MPRRNYATGEVIKKPKPDEILKMMMQPPDEKLDNKLRLYECTCCGRQFDTQKGNFTRCSSPLFQANDKFLPICDACVRSMLSQYKSRFNNEEQAFERVCLHFDIYWDIDLLDTCDNKGDILVRFKEYCRKCCIVSREGRRTYDEYLASHGDIPSYMMEIKAAELDGALDPDVIERWGPGIFTAEDYDALELHYQMLKKQNPNCDSNQEIFIKDLCVIKWQQMNAIKNHNVNDYQKLTQLYHDTFSEAGLKVGQEAIEGGDATLGVTLETISRYTPEEYYQDQTLYKDFDGLGEYFQRFILRPLRNLIHGTGERDHEYRVPDGDGNDS